MKKPRSRISRARSRAPGEEAQLAVPSTTPAAAGSASIPDASRILSQTRAGRRRRWSLRDWSVPSRSMFASGLALTLCTAAACALSVPGFVLGAEAPGGTTTETFQATVIVGEETTPVDTGPAPAETIAADSEAASVAPAAEAPEVVAPAAVSAAASEGTPSTGVLLATLPWGDGPGQVGLAAPGEGLSRGPEAAAVAADGRVAVLDSVNHRVVLLDAQGLVAGHVPVNLAEPRFLAVTNERLYVMDCDADRRLAAFDWSGAQVADVALPQWDDVVTALLATKQGPCVEIAHDKVFLVDVDKFAADGTPRVRELPGRPLDNDVARIARASFKPGDGVGLALGTVDKKGWKSSLGPNLRPKLSSGKAVEHLVSVDGDGAGGLVVGARLAATPESSSGADTPALALTRVIATRSDVAAAGPSLLLAECTYTYLGQPYVVTPDGRVIQPVADETGYSLLVHTFVEGQEVSR